MAELLRRLPSVDALLRALPPGAPGSHIQRVTAARRLLDDQRAAMRQGANVPALAALTADLVLRLEQTTLPSLRPVINASGVILQTNLGRAPLSDAAIAAMDAAARDYTNIEFDLVAGARGSRHEHVRTLIREVTGAEDGMLVNNNAAALFMTLQVFASGREVIISRGQAVEIGGGFRIPDVMRQSGARIVEVGTTNRTYARDYAAAITAETAAVLRVHSSNFRVVGFTAEASITEMAGIARHHNVLLVDDLGSGCLVPTAPYGLAPEPTVQESVAAGADLILFSGDKLLGGPQCGVIAGSSRCLAELRRHPLARALRVDKLTIAAFEATMQSYAAGTHERDLPVWRMVSLDAGTIRRRAAAWARATGGTVIASRSMVGGGSLPGEGLDTWCLAIDAGSGADSLAARLRMGSPAVVARIEDGAVLFDPRTVDPRHDKAVADAITGTL
jgi:L-seryl-tRNA(Ser) seleniumtransferase